MAYRETFAAVLIWPRRYFSAISSCRSLNSVFFSLYGRSRRGMISELCWCSYKSSRSRSDSLRLKPLLGLTPHSSSSLPEVLDLLRFLPFGRQKEAVVIFNSPPSKG